MPRGVPASGRRQPRSVPAPTATVEASEAVDAQDEEDRVVRPADTETPGDVAVAAVDELVNQTVDLAGRADHELSPEELEIKRLRDQLARERGRKDIEPEVDESDNAPSEQNIIIHVLEDGVTALGKIWYRGDELEFKVGSKAHKDTFDRNGRSWLDLRHDEFAQAERWGKVMFRNGPWPGKSYTDGAFEALRGVTGGMVQAPTPEELAAAEKARKRRAAPHLPVGV